MKPHFYVFLSLSAVLLLSGCVSREQADAKLVNGCKAAIGIFIENGFSIKEIKKTEFSTPDTIDGDRTVTLQLVESDDWYNNDKTYSCNFIEQFGFMQMNYTAEIYQLNMNDKIYGKKDGQILTSLKDWLKITDTVGQALDQ